MFYTFNQNNSGGRFDVTKSVGHVLIVEADSADEANEIAENYIYFNGCETGMDCSCCGDRWYPVFRDKEGGEVPSHYGVSVYEPEKIFDSSLPPLRDEWICDIYRKDGSHERLKYNARKIYEENRKKEREMAKTLWGTSINLYGLYSNKPIKLYEDPEEKYNKKKWYYNKSENFGCSDLVKSKDKSYWTDDSDGEEKQERELSYFFFASENKKDVEEFIKGVIYAYESLLYVGQTLTEGLKKTGFPSIDFEDFPEKRSKFFSLGIEKALNQMRRLNK